MEPILQWGLDFIRMVQIIANPPLTFFMKAITSLGGEYIYMILLPVIFWCINEKKGLHLGFVIFISTWINMSLKYLFDQPRPFFEGYDPSLGMINESMGGLPSGHAQNTLVMYFILAFWIKKSLIESNKKNWAYAGAAVLCFLISFSRIYLGVHFPTDIIAGWILGGIILLIYFMFIEKIETLLVKGGFRAGMIATAIVSFIMILYIPDKSLLMPGGILFGFGAGYCLNRRYIGFICNNLLDRTDAKKYLVLTCRILIGIAGFILFLFVADSLVLKESSNIKLFLFIQLSLAGFWVSAAAPWIFIKIRLAGTNISDSGTEKK
jgi:membrane-associated phospholipid phosphatase